jgi:hypothetical protein
MKNFNEYDSIKFKSTFQNTELYNKIVENADVIIWEKLHPKIFITNTPREEHVKKVVSLAPFYYLQFLTEIAPSKIYDIGCGMNYFKKFIPSIVGISADLTRDGKIVGDVYGRFDKNFILKHKFDSAFSINALHFIPLTQLRQCILDFISIINKGGRGFLALNCQRMVERISNKERNLIFPEGMNSVLLDGYIREQFDSIENIKILCLDIDLTILDEFMNGNIRIVFEKIN